MLARICCRTYTERTQAVDLESRFGSVNLDGPWCLPKDTAWGWSGGRFGRDAGERSGAEGAVSGVCSAAIQGDYRSVASRRRVRRIFQGIFR